MSDRWCLRKKKTQETVIILAITFGAANGTEMTQCTEKSVWEYMCVCLKNAFITYLFNLNIR